MNYLTRKEAAARNMHVIHQFVLWLLRLAGLRISVAVELALSPLAWFVPGTISHFAPGSDLTCPI